MSHIFISYSKQNIDFARHLRRLLQDQGFAVWMDETQLGASEKWWSSIEQNIIDCSAFIIIMSPASKNSDWVEREILVAEDQDYKKPIFPVLLDGKVWSRLANIQYEDMRAGLNATLTPALVRRLEAIVPRGNAAVAPPPLPGIPLPTATTQSHPRSRLSEGALVAIITGIFAVIVAVIGILPNLPPFAAQPTATIAATFTDSPSPTDTAVLPTDTPSPTNTPIPTVVIQPSTTATAVIDLGATATQIYWQRAADAQEATNAALFAENTQIAQTTTARTLPITTNTIQYMPCQGIISSLGSANLVAIRNQRNGQVTSYLDVGTPVIVIGKFENGGTKRYEISDENNLSLGWIDTVNIAFLTNCPKQ